MNVRLAERVLTFAVLACFAMLFLCVPMAHAQSAGTGAIVGTVTDPSGGAVTGATVTATNTGTNQSREAKTGGDGVYKFTLLNPGNYRLKFSAQGFKSSEIASVTVNVTETETSNMVLEVGAVTESVTVEGTVETLQTESSTLGTTVSGSQINALPMANGNYTEILSLSAGTNATVANATELGKGTQDISANGVDPGSNNFQMDGVAVNNIANSGSSNDGTIYTGIPIPSQDAIGEFKVQTSTYDASYGRNPGANVNVTTKSGTNAFHGSAFEFFRNTVLNSNDFFLKQGQLSSGSTNTRAPFNQNQFGATIGGPIKKDKFFFFFSYRGTRSKNAAAPQGKDFGASLLAPPFGNPALQGFAALGSRGTCPSPVPSAGNPDGPDTLTVSACDATAQAFANALGISSIQGLRIMQLTTGSAKNPNAGGVPNNYYIPAPASYPQFCDNNAASPRFGICDFNIPAIYTENQYVANGDYIVNSKNTISTKYFYTHNPYTTFLGQAGGNLPGTPEDIIFGNHAAVAKLTTLVTNTFINEARISFQQNVNAATVEVPPGGCPNADNLPKPFGCGSPQQLGMQSLVPGFYEPPTMLNVFTGYGMFGGLLPDKGPTNQLQAADQISWSHGKHSIRAGYEFEWTNWPLSDPGLQQGLIIMGGYCSYLSGVQFGPGCSLAPGLDVWNLGCLFCVKSTSGAPNTSGVLHFYQVNNQNGYVLDDWKVNSRLTINVGLRWEYFGLMSDKYGHLTQVTIEHMAPNSVVPTCLGDTGPGAINPCGPGGISALPANPNGVQQYTVPSNFIRTFGQPPAGVAVSDNRHSIAGHTPYDNFAPRLGFAWQPLSGGKLVVRGGAGIFYDRIGLDRVVHAFEQGYPYAATYDFGAFSPRWFRSTLAVPFFPISLVCLPNDPNCNSEPNGLGFAARWADPTTVNSPFGSLTSGLNTPYNPSKQDVPLIQEFSLGIQYEFVPRWVLEVGYVGSIGTHITDYNHNHNGAVIVRPGDAVDQLYGICTGVAPNQICNTTGNIPFRTPFVGYEPVGLQASDWNGNSSYNSLQVTVRHQFSHGLSLQGAYTWGRDLSDVFFGNSANINDALVLRGQPGLNGPKSGQWGPVNYDRTQRLVVNYSYDLPFGKGTQGFVNHVVGGWNVSGVTIAQSGNPLTFIGGGTGGAYGTNQQLIFQGVTTAEFCPNKGNGDIKTHGSARSNLNNYFQTTTFGCPAPLVPFGGPGATDYGNSAVGIATGPGQWNWDISIVKNTQITERVRMQFRSDFYNAFNHAQFAPPQGGNFGTVGFENVGNIFPGSVGNSITATTVNPRLIQFGLHFFF